MTNYKQNLHTHTVYCDGKNTPEEIIKEAIAAGFDSIGFSGHAYTGCDESYCMSREETKKYREEIISLRKKYADRIKIYLGIEQDAFSDPIDYPWDYIIGSVHYVLVNDIFIPVDDSREELVKNILQYYEGHVYEFLADYYQMVARIPQITGCDIIGHFDLNSKFNEGGTLFDPGHPKYIEAWTNALNKIFTSACMGSLFTSAQRNGASITGAPIFEINTGAMSRGYRKAPYPASDILRAICMRGGRIMINSDSHEKTTQDASFDLAADLAREAGFTEQTVLTDEGFISIPL